jgi:hypothetical protein
VTAPAKAAWFSHAVDNCHFFPNDLSFVKAGGTAGCIFRGPERRNYTLRLIVTWGAAGS